jgi:hypothetical protein
VNEIIAHEWTTLKGLWETCDRTRVHQSVQDEVDRIFVASTMEGEIGKSGPKEWWNINRAEQVVGRCLSEIQLGIEFQVLMALAEERKIPSLEVHRKNAALFSIETAATAESQQQCERPKPTQAFLQKQAAYMALLHSLQSGFVEQRYRRTARRIAARVLVYYGGGLLALFDLVVLLLLYTGAWQNGFEERPWLAWFAAPVFGLLGAYFSRLLQFQATLKFISVDELTQLPASWSLLLRLGSGMIGAIVLFILLCAGLVDGTFFPNMGQIGVAHMTEWNVKVTATVARLESGEAMTDIHSASASMEIAKLLIWSFIAGFSERLVPSALESTEGRAQG